MELREFTKTEWYGFAGAERWPDSEPLLAEGAFADGMLWVLVLDRQGACLVCDDPQASYGGYALNRPFLSAAEARTFAASLGDPGTRGAFFAAGFAAV
jgi:hypothetical protein